MKHMMFVEGMARYNDLVLDKVKYFYSKVAEYNPVGYLVEHVLGVGRDTMLHTPLESVITYGILAIPILYLLAKVKRRAI